MIVQQSKKMDIQKNSLKIQTQKESDNHLGCWITLNHNPHHCRRARVVVTITRLNYGLYSRVAMVGSDRCRPLCIRLSVALQHVHWIVSDMDTWNQLWSWVSTHPCSVRVR